MDVDGRAPFVRNALDAAVGDGTLAVPALENGADAAPELFHGVVGELAAENFLDLGLVLLAERLEIVGRQVGVFGDAPGFLHGVHEVLELNANALALGGLDAFGLFHDDVGVHRDEAAVGVVDEALVARLLDQARNRLGAEPDVEHGFHHAGHGATGAGTAGDEERILRVAVFHAHGCFGLLEGRLDLFLEAGGELLAFGEEGGAALGGDGESGGDGQSEIAHFGQVRSLAAEEIALGGVAVRSG